MPGVAPNPISRVTQCFVLQPFGVQSGRSPVRDQKFAAAGNKMRHRPSRPDVAVQPKTTGHREDHPFAAVFELTPDDGWRRWAY
jgi:hypothetical protein